MTSAAEIRMKYDKEKDELVSGILLILSFVGNHEEQSLSFHLVEVCTSCSF